MTLFKQVICRFEEGSCAVRIHWCGGRIVKLR